MRSAEDLCEATAGAKHPAENNNKALLFPHERSEEDLSRALLLFDLVEARRVELLSTTVFTETSPGAVDGWIIPIPA